MYKLRLDKIERVIMTISLAGAMIVFGKHMILSESFIGYCLMTGMFFFVILLILMLWTNERR